MARDGAALAHAKIDAECAHLNLPASVGKLSLPLQTTFKAVPRDASTSFGMTKGGLERNFTLLRKQYRSCFPKIRT